MNTRSPGLSALAAHFLLDLHDAHLRAARPVVAQQFLDGARREFRIFAQRLQFPRETQQRQQAVGDVVGGGLVAGEQQQDAGGDELVLATGGRRRLPGATSCESRSSFAFFFLSWINSQKKPAISFVALSAMSYLSGDMRELPMNSAMSSDMRFTFASSSFGTPSIAMITSAGSGPAKSATKSISLRAPMRSSSHCVSSSAAGRIAFIDCRWNTLLVSRRRRVCSGGSRNTIQCVR